MTSKDFINNNDNKINQINDLFKFFICNAAEFIQQRQRI